MLKDALQAEYEKYCNLQGDIYKHLPMLNKLANECKSVTEFGVRTGISTRAFLNSTCKLRSYDITLDVSVMNMFNVVQYHKKDCEYIIANSLNIEIEETDMLFIDSNHTYQHLSQELNLHHSKVKKYIAFHDTYICGFVDLLEYSAPTTNPLKVGLLTAIIDFMIDHPEWKFKYHTIENNGLTVIERIT
jgi:cephalosporin hydroxylase